MSGLRALLVAAAFLGLGCATPAASFHCSGKLAFSEKLICSDAALSALDYKLGAFYDAALDVADSAPQLRAQQRNWLDTERSICADAACLSALYQARIDVLKRIIQGRASPLPGNLSGRVEHAPNDGAYCRDADGAGDWFSIAMSTAHDGVSGEIDGIFNCGQHVWGPIDIHGREQGNVAVVQFDAAFSSSETQTADALIFVFKDRIYWRVLSEMHVQSFAPTSEILVCNCRLYD